MKVKLGALIRGVAGKARPWRPTGAPYPALATFDPATLAKQSGVYALWHLGVRPRWLRVGGAADLGAALARAKDAADIRANAVHGGVYIAWAPLPADRIPGALAALVPAMRPHLQSLELPGELRAAPAQSGAFPLPPGAMPPAVDETPAGNRQG